MPTDTLPRELTAVIEPDGRYALDWRDGHTEIGAPAAEFQQN